MSLPNNIKDREECEKCDESCLENDRNYIVYYCENGSICRTMMQSNKEKPS